MSRAGEVDAALTWLERKGTQRDRDNMVRFGIVTDNAFGVSMAHLKILARQLGKDHDLAAGLWDTGVYDARMLASLVDEPARVTPAQMDRWRADFDNWGICDTVCFHLFDKTPHAFAKVAKWRNGRDEYGKRAAFALLASVALHDRKTPDAPYIEGLAFIEAASDDERNFVKKGVNWALRAIGMRNRALNTAAVRTATRLAASADATPRWVGKDALRALTKPALAARLAARVKSRASA